MSISAGHSGILAVHLLVTSVCQLHSFLCTWLQILDRNVPLQPPRHLIPPTLSNTQTTTIHRMITLAIKTIIARYDTVCSQYSSERWSYPTPTSSTVKQAMSTAVLSLSSTAPLGIKRKLSTDQVDKLFFKHIFIPTFLCKKITRHIEQNNWLSCWNACEDLNQT